jgi:hypothetical protein
MKRNRYEPRIVGGKVVMMPAELQKLHRHVLDAEVIEVISDDMREVVEDEWPELTYKLPPRAAARTSAAITPGRPQNRSRVGLNERLIIPEDRVGRWREGHLQLQFPLNAAQQGRYQRWSWKIPQEPPACREVSAPAGLQQARRPNRFPAVPCGLGAASAPPAEGKCGRCCAENRPAPYRRLDCPALPQMQSSRWHTEWPEGRAWDFPGDGRIRTAGSGIGSAKPNEMARDWPHVTSVNKTNVRIPNPAAAPSPHGEEDRSG